MSRRLDQERQQQLEPRRLAECKEKLESLGLFVEVFDGNRLEFEYNLFTIKFWPYSGWHTGKGIDDGRGFEHLLKQLVNV